MENIVIGLLKSQHNIKLKKAFVERLINTTQLPSSNFQLTEFLNEIKSHFSIGLNNNLNLDLSVPFIKQLEQSNQRYETLIEHYDLIFLVFKYLLDYVNNVKSNELAKTYNDLVVDLINLVKVTFLPNLSTINNRSYFLIKNDLIILFIWSRLISESILSTTNNNELRFNLLNFLLILNQNLLQSQQPVGKFHGIKNDGYVTNCSPNYLYFMQTDSNFCSNYLRLIRTILVNLVDDYTNKQEDNNQSASVLIEKCLVEVITLLMVSVIKEQPAESNSLDKNDINDDEKAKINNIKDNFDNLKHIVELIRYFILKSEKLFEITLKFLIDMLSTNSNESNKYLFNGGAIAELFNCFELSKSKIVIEDFFKNPVENNIDDESINLFLNNLIRLLSWPFENNIDQWVITLMTYLAVISKKFKLLITLCEENIDLVLRFVQNKNCSKVSLNVLSFFLLNYKHSPKLFHKSCPKLIKILEKYKQDQDKTIYNHLTMLTFACMHNFGGYPAIYKPLLDVIQNDFDLTNFESFISKYVISNNMQNIQFNIHQSSQQDDDQIDTNIDESSYEMMNKKLRKNVTGLVNLGNTCYLNSMIQSLYSCRKFLKFILEMHLEKQQDTSFLVQLQILFSIMHFSERKAIKPSSFLKNCTPSWFVLGQQQDSSEFLIFLLDNLQEQLKTSANENSKMNIYSNLITKLFGIQLTTEIICKQCNTKTNRSDIGFYLPLSFNQDTSLSSNETNLTAQSKNKSLQTLIDNFFHTELLSSETDNSYQCSKCESLQSATKQIFFTRDDSKNIQPPEYLILTLNRFIYSFSNNISSNKKIMEKLDYPNQLIIKTINDQKIINEIYELNSIVIHSGSSLHYGHYYSYITNKKSTNETTKAEINNGHSIKMDIDEKKNDYEMEWLLANDAQINSSTYDGLVANLNLFKDDTPYVLFYRRISDKDSDESADIDDKNIKNKNLINFIEQDNKIYVVEEKNRIMNMIKMKKQAKNSANSSINNKNYSYSSKEDDDDEGGNTSGQPDTYCSNDSQRDSGPRIIF